MSTFKSQRSTRTVDIRKAYTGTGIVMVWEGGSINLHPSDAPAIALAVLESAGEPEFVLDGNPEAFTAVALEYLRKSIHAAELNVLEATRNKRRDELARELWNVRYDDLMTEPGRKSVNMIIDGELELAKERDAK